MSGMRMRAARNADVPAVEAMVSAAFAAFTEETGIVPAPVATDWVTVISAMGVSVATRDEELVGVLVMWPHPDHVLVETLAVAPAEQGSGVGTALLARAEAVARETGTDAVRLYTNAAMTQALAFYPRHGFTEVGRSTEHGFARVFFEKRLA